MNIIISDHSNYDDNIGNVITMTTIMIEPASAGPGRRASTGRIPFLARSSESANSLLLKE